MENIYIETLEGDTLCVEEWVPAHLIAIVLAGVQTQYPDARSIWADIPHTERAFLEATRGHAYDMGEDIIEDNGEGFPDDDEELDRLEERLDYAFASENY